MSCSGPISVTQQRNYPRPLKLLFPADCKIRYQHLLLRQRALREYVRQGALAEFHLDVQLALETTPALGIAAAGAHVPSRVARRSGRAR